MKEIGGCTQGLDSTVNFSAGFSWVREKARSGEEDRKTGLRDNVL